MATNVPVTLDTLITVKIAIQGNNRKFKIPLKDLGAHVLPDKLRTLLSIPSSQEVIFERYSDSAGAYITLDSDNAQVYKTLFRAAKAKLKLRLRATLVPGEDEQPPVESPKSPVPTLQSISSRCRLSTGPVSPPPVPSQASPTIVRSPIPPRPTTSYNYNRMAAFSKAISELEKPVPASQPLPKADVDEAPLPRPFPAGANLFPGLAASRSTNLAIRPKENASQSSCSWVVYCNSCDNPMANEHFHCSICDNGDYDLCTSCVDSGVHCPGAGHWMVKRFVKNGTVVNSSTERIGPKVKAEPEQDMPGAFTDEKKAELYEDEPSRTCNSCVKVFSEKEFVTCSTCDDFDLCIPCHVGTKHGHHPGHAFKAATPETHLTALADFLCCEGRNVRHAAVCDGCEKFIYGVRHKCLNCPDWDFCSTCIKSAKYIHPHHRFVPIFEPLPEPRTSTVRHYGIYCDGPLCKDKENLSYIEGIRYKCAVCHDTDFCANCEAVPTNRHNRTHPLIKFKTPVRNVSVTTMGEDKNGAAMATMGDYPSRRSTATETLPPAPSANAATQVQTIVDLKPTEEPVAKLTKEKIQIKDLLAEPIQEKIKVEDLLATPVPAMEKQPEPVKAESSKSAASNEAFNAHFIRDTITDGTKISADNKFVQVWTLRNPGPRAWPAGCSVRFVGGDNMLNVDNSHPSSASDLAEATESNVIGRPVEVGEEISFRVVMKAPKRAGVAISYWRLKSADGMPFGHRLWCDIEVVPPPSPAPTLSLLDRQQNRTSFAETQESLPRAPEDAAQREHFAHKLMALRQVALKRMQEQSAAKRAEAAKASDQETHAPEPSVAPEEPIEEEQPEEPARELRSKDSQMIFPQLDKESPVSSIHETTEAKPEPEAEKAESENGTVAAPSSHEESDFFEDAESVEIMDASSDDEGFMTDEEYDILDASDEEIV